MNLRIEAAALPTGELAPMPIEPAWIIEGTPTARGNILMQSADKKISYGTWECSAGKFHWLFAWDEFIHIQEGEVEITDETGQVVKLHKGDLAHFPVGMKTVWNVPNYVRKVFTLRTVDPLG